MIAILYDSGFARIYPGINIVSAEEEARETDLNPVFSRLTRKRQIKEAWMVLPPISGTAFCVDCIHNH